MHRGRLAILFTFWLPLAGIAADQTPKQSAPNAARQAANKTQAKAANAQARAAQQALNAPKLPGGLTLQRLAQMTPEERAAALADLPPARRQSIEQKVQNYANLTPEQQQLYQNEAERLRALPPDKREDVRESLREFRQTPQPRRAVLRREMNRLAAMPEEQRSVYMSRPAFRSRFSEAEIRMMNNLRGILP